MRCNHRTSLAFVLLATAWFSHPAAASPHDTEVLITPYAASTSFTWEEITSSLLWIQASPILAAGPVHGELISGPGDSLHYFPENSFWELGTDSFIFRVDMPGTSAYVTVTLQASDHGAVRRIDESFEQPPVSSLSGDTEILAEASIAGLKGLRATAGGWSPPDAVFTFLNSGVQGPGAQGGTDETKVRPPPMIPLLGDPIVIYSLDREPGADPAADIALTPIGGSWAMIARLYRDDSVYATSPFQLRNQDGHHLMIDWWNDDELERAGGLRLWIDGELAGSLTDISGWWVGRANRRVGVMLKPTSEIGMTVDVDDLRLSKSEYARAAFYPTLRDGFDADLGAWQNHAPFSIEVTEEAALIGPGGLAIKALTEADSILWDPSPASETSFGVRMRLSTEDLEMMVGRTLELFALSAAEILGAAGDQARLVLRRDPNEFKLIAQTRDDEGNGWRSTDAVSLATGSNTIELRWQAADSGDNNGWVRLWVNGSPSPRIDGLANSDATIESQRLGAWNVEAGAQGAFFVDAFESWAFVPRQSPSK